MKILISSCLLGNVVRWNNQSKLNQDLIQWAQENGIELVPICPENELYGTPRSTIRLIQADGRLQATFEGRDIADELREKCQELAQRYSDALGFIGIHGSPSCGINVGVKNLGKTTKGFMHKTLSHLPTTESNMLRGQENRDIFLKRVKKPLDK